LSEHERGRWSWPTQHQLFVCRHVALQRRLMYYRPAKQKNLLQ
jgi:hypothetical protein